MLEWQSVAQDFCSTQCEVRPPASVEIPRLSEPQLSFSQAAELFSVFAEKSRLRILYALRSRSELCVCEIACLLESSTSVASHHLRMMKDAGVLANRSEGKLVYYRLVDPQVEALLGIILDRVISIPAGSGTSNGTSSMRKLGASYG